MNLLGFDPGLGFARIAGCPELFPPRALAATLAGGMITITRAATGEALICAPAAEIAGLDGAAFADAAACLAYLTRALAQRPAGDPIKVAIAATDLSGQRVVRDLGDGSAGYASALDPAHRNAVLGVTVAAADAGTPVDVVTAGPITSPRWGLAPGLPLFLGADGMPTQAPPAAPAAFALRIGLATDPDTAVIRIGAPIVLL